MQNKRGYRNYSDLDFRTTNSYKHKKEKLINSTKLKQAEKYLKNAYKSNMTID